MRDTFQAYSQSIKNFNPLSITEQCILFEGIKKGDKIASDKLVHSCTKFVVAMAKKYANINRGAYIEDLISAGNLALYEAMGKFDNTRGIHFVTYARHFIKRNILNEIGYSTRPVSIHNDILDDYSKILKGTNKLSQKLQREPTITEISTETNFTPKQITTLGFMNGDTSQGDMDPLRTKNRDSSDIKYKVEQFIKECNVKPKYMDVVRLYYGINASGEAIPIKDISDRCSLTQSRVRQIRDNVIRDLSEYNIKNKQKNLLHFGIEELV